MDQLDLDLLDVSSVRLASASASEARCSCSQRTQTHDGVTQCSPSGCQCGLLSRVCDGRVGLLGLQ